MVKLLEQARSYRVSASFSGRRWLIDYGAASGSRLLVDLVDSGINFIGQFFALEPQASCPYAFSHKIITGEISGLRDGT